MLVELNLPPCAAAWQASSNISVRDFARMIASLVALSAANIRVSRSFCSSALAFSFARSKLSSANETFSAIRASSAMISSSTAHDLPTKNVRTPTLSPALIRGTATQATTPVSCPACCQGPPSSSWEIVVDARALGPERLAADAFAVLIIGIDRELRPRDQIEISPVAGGRLQPGRTRLGQQDGGGDGLSAVDGGIADPLVELLLGLGAKNGFVGRADGAEHPGQPSHRPLAVLARRLMVEIIERKGKIRRHALAAARRSGRSIEPGSCRVTSKTPTLRPLQVNGSAAAAPTCPARAPWRQANERASFRKSLLMDTFWSRKACPQTPDPSGVLATIEMSMLRSRTVSSPKPAAKRSRLVSGSSKKTAVARKSPLEKAASQTFSYNSSGDFAYRIASLVAFNAAKVRAILVFNVLELPCGQHGRPLRTYAEETPKWTLLPVLNRNSE